FAGICLGDTRGPHAVADLERIARDHALTLALTLPARVAIEPGGKGFERLLGACGRAAGASADEVRDRLVAHLGNHKADHLYLYFLAASRGHAGLATTQHYRESGGFWFR